MDHGELLELMRSRRSVRRFLPRPPSRKEIEELVEAARWAPSNHNRQGFRFIVFEDPDEIGKLSREVRACLLGKVKAAQRISAQIAEELVHHATWFGDAPCLVLVLSKRPVAVGAELMEGVPHPELVSGEPLSAAMAVQNMLLAARALGLGSCVLTAPLIASEVLAGIPGLPPGFEAACLVALGYPAEEPGAPRRKRIDQLVEYRGRP